MVHSFNKPLLSTYCMQTWLKVLQKQHEVNTPSPVKPTLQPAKGGKKKKDMMTVRR